MRTMQSNGNDTGVTLADLLRTRKAMGLAGRKVDPATMEQIQAEASRGAGGAPAGQRTETEGDGGGFNPQSIMGILKHGKSLADSMAGDEFTTDKMGMPAYKTAIGADGGLTMEAVAPGSVPGMGAAMGTAPTASMDGIGLNGMMTGGDYGLATGAGTGIDGAATGVMADGSLGLSSLGSMGAEAGMTSAAESATPGIMSALYGIGGDTASMLGGETLSGLGADALANLGTDALLGAAESAGAGMASGAASGATAGSSFGPIGAGVGAAAGLLASLLAR